MGNRIRGITVEIGGDTTGLQTALQGVNSRIRDTSSQLKDVDKLLKLDPTNTELLTQRQGILAQAIQSTNEKLQTLRTASEQAMTALNNGEISQAQFDALQREIIATEQALEQLTDRANESTTAVVRLAQSGESLKKLGGNVTEIGQKMLPVSGAVAGLGMSALATASNFESSMSQVQATLGVTKDSTSALNGEVVNTMDSLEDLAIEMGSKTAFSASQCAEAINYLALAGYNTQEVYDTLPLVLDLASAGGMELAQTSDMVTDAMSALGLSVDGASELVNQMAKTSTKSSTSIAQLGEGILTVGGTAKSLAGGTAELNTALGILANNGIKGAEGGTALRNILLSLQTPTDKAKEKMVELGLQVFDANGDMRSLNDILLDLQGSLSSMTNEESSNAIASLFNTTDLKSVEALLGSTGVAFEELQATIVDSTGTASQMAETQLDNLSGQLTTIMASLEGLAIAMGKILIPYFKTLAEKVQVVLNVLNGLDKEQRALIVTVGLFLVALAPTVIIIGKLITAVGTIMTALSKLGIFINTVKTAMMGLNLAFSVTPIGLLVAGIATLVAGFLYLYTTCSDFRGFWDDMWQKIATSWETFTANITTFFEDIGVAIATGIVEITTNITTFFEGVGVAIATKVEEISIFFSTIWESIATTISTVLEEIALFISTIWESIQTTISTVLEEIALFISTIWESISTTISTVLEEISLFISTIWESIQTTISTVLEEIALFISTIWESIQTTISTKLEEIYNTITTIWGDIVTTISTVLGEISSTVLEIFEEMKEAVSSKVESISESIQNGLDTAFEYIKGIPSQAFSWGANIISSLVKGIQSSISSVTAVVKTVTGKLVFGKSIELGTEETPESDTPQTVADKTENNSQAVGITQLMNSPIPQSRSSLVQTIEDLTQSMAFTPQFQTLITPQTMETPQPVDLSSITRTIAECFEKFGGTPLGDIVIPVTFGGVAIDDIVINATQRANLRSGGH